MLVVQQALRRIYQLNELIHVQKTCDLFSETCQNRCLRDLCGPLQVYYISTGIYSPESNFHDGTSSLR